MINFRLLRHLYLFSVVAQKGNIGHAAESLGMSQPPLSEHIKTLETHLGMTLFHRSKQGVSLTSDGHRLLPKVLDFVERMQTLSDEMADVQAGVNQPIRVGAITQAMTQILPKTVQQYRKFDPTARISIQEIDSVQAILLLQAGKIDVALVRTQLDELLPPQMVMLPVFDDELCVVVAKWHALATQNKVHLARLKDERFVMHQRSVSPASFDEVMAVCQQAGFLPKISAQTTSAATQIAQAGCSDLVALTSKSLQSFAGDGVFVPVLDNQDKPIRVSAIVLLHRKDDKAVQEFVRFIISPSF